MAEVDDGRHFDNNLPEDGQGLVEDTGGGGGRLTAAFVSRLKNESLRILHCLETEDPDACGCDRGDFTVYTGTAGRAYLYLRLAQLDPSTYEKDSDYFIANYYQSLIIITKSLIIFNIVHY